MGEHPLKIAIEYLEQLMDEEERTNGKYVVRFRVFVNDVCVSDQAPFFLDRDAANNQFNDIARNIGQRVVEVSPQATRAVVRFEDKSREWTRPPRVDNSGLDFLDNSTNPRG
jgi:hypothetical protein